MNATALQNLTTAIGVVVGVVWGAVVVGMALRKRYKGFGLALVEAQIINALVDGTKRPS